MKVKFGGAESQISDMVMMMVDADFADRIVKMSEKSVDMLSKSGRYDEIETYLKLRDEFKSALAVLGEDEHE